MSTESGPRDEARELRNRLVEELVSQGAITSQPVRQAFAEVPRHLFVPRVDIATAYSDQPIFIRWNAGVPISSSSQPKIPMSPLGIRWEDGVPISSSSAAQDDGPHDGAVGCGARLTGAGNRRGHRL